MPILAENGLRREGDPRKLGRETGGLLKRRKELAM